MKSRVCIISPSTLPVPDVKGGAIERVITMIAEENENQKKLDLVIVSNPDEEAVIQQSNFLQTKFVNIKPYYSVIFRKFIRKIHTTLFSRFGIDFAGLYKLSSPRNRYLIENKDKFDIIVSENASYDQIYSAAACIGKDRIVYHLHGNTKENNLLAHSFGNVFSVSEFINTQYLKTSSLPPGRAITVFNGIDTARFQKKITIIERNYLRKKLNLCIDDFVIVFCGRIVPQKGVLELINAIESLNNPQIKLLIIGSSNFGQGNMGEYAAEVKKRVVANEKMIRFTGFIPNQELYKYHQVADIGVVPSMYTDPCPLALFELITSGLPTIATAAGGMLETGTDETTIFVPLENIEKGIAKAIKTLYSNECLRDSMRSAAIKRSDYFKRDRFYNDFCKSVEKLILLNAC